MCRLRRPEGRRAARDQRVLDPGGGNADAAAVREPTQQREPLQSVARLFRWLRMLDINLPSRRMPSAASCCRLDMFKSFGASPERPFVQVRFVLILPAQPATPAFRFESRRILSPASLSLRWRHPEAPKAVEKFHAEDRSHKPCEAEPEHRLESVANVQTDTDLHVRPRFSNRTDEKSPRRRDAVRNTRGAPPRNGIDFALRDRLLARAPHAPRRAS